MLLNESNHLRDSLRGKNRQQVGNQQELVALTIDGSLWLEAAKRNTLAVVRSAPPSVDQGSVEAVDVKVGSIDEETFAHCAVTI